MKGRMRSHYLLFVVLVSNATLMLKAIPLPEPIPDGDYITYIGPIQLINTGESTDTEQVLRIVGSVQSAIENMVGNKPGVNLEISLGNKKIDRSSIQSVISEPAPGVAQDETTAETLADTAVAEIETAPTEPPEETMNDTESLMPRETTNSVRTMEEPSVVPGTENAKKKHVVTVVEMSNQTLIYVYDPLTVQPGMEPWKAYESSGARILGSTQQESSTSAAEIVTEVTVQTEPITFIESTEATQVAEINEMSTEKPGTASMLNWLIKCLLSSDSTKTTGTTTNENESSKSSSWSSSWSNLHPSRSITVSHESPARSPNERFGSRKPSSTFTSWSSLNPQWTPKTVPIQTVKEFDPRKIANLNSGWTPKIEPMKEVTNDFEPQKISKGNRNSLKPNQSSGRRQGNTGWNQEQSFKRTRTEHRFINEPFVHFGSHNSGRKSRQPASAE